MMMPEKRACEECGTELPANAPQGLCPRCLIDMALHLSPVPQKTIRLEPIEPALEQIGRYKILQPIGEGGCGVVYLAEQQEPVRRRVALKVIKLGMDTKEVIARFDAERQALALMDHSNIAKALDAGATEAGRPYFVMELVKGVRITDYCDRNRLSTRERLDLFIQVCRAIQHAHQKGIIHRDIKPSNILVSLHDGVPVPKVIDFGIAKATTDQHLTDKTVFTALEQFIGTPAYMSPEQAEMSGLDIDTRTDIYSLGVLLYELLTGKTPFDAKELLAAGLGEMRRIIREVEPVRPSKVLESESASRFDRSQEATAQARPSINHHLKSLSIDLDWIVMKALEKDRTRRYETANGLAIDVQRYLADEPVLARPPSRAYRFQKLVRRNKVVFTVGGIAISALILALSVSTWLFFQERNARQRAVTAEEREGKARQAAERSANVERQNRYNSDMNHALAALHEGNPAQAFELLRRHKPNPGESDLRGFEWRHLWHRCRGDYELALPFHNQVVGSMTFSSDGKLLATWCWDNTLRIWGLETRTNLLTVTNATSLGGFLADSGEFLFGRQNGSIVKYRPGTGQQVLLLTNAGDVVTVAANGKAVVTIDHENRLRIWDLEARQLRFLLPEPVRRRLDFSWGAGVAIAPQADVLAVVEQNSIPGRPDHGIKLWNIDSGTNLTELVERRQIHCLEFSPDGKMLAVGDGGGSEKNAGASEGGGSVWLWDLATFEAQKVTAGASPVLSLAFSPTGEILAGGSSDEKIVLWDIPALSLRQRDFRHNGAVWALAFSPDGRHLASGSRNETVKIWKLKGEEHRTVISNLDSREWGNFCFSADSKLMAAGCKDRTVRIWDVETLELRGTLHGASYAAGFAQDGRLLTSSKDELPKWWDPQTQTTRAIRAYPERLEGAVPCVDLSPDRRIAALGFKNGSIPLLDIESEHVIATVKAAHPGGVDCLAFSPLGGMLISGGRDKSVALWELSTQQNLDRFDLLSHSAEHKGSVCAVAISPDGKLLASGCSLGTLKFWDPADHLQKSVKTIAYHQSVIRTLCFSPDLMTLASGSEDNTVKLWNTKTYQIVASIDFGERIRLVLFSPDGNNLAVVTDQGSLHLLRATPKNQADAELAAYPK